jgi:uridine kinase
MHRTDQLIKAILAKRRHIARSRPIVVGISGIDASGKGFISSWLADTLTSDFNVALINTDDWLNLPEVRFSGRKPGEHFYKNAIRFDEMFHDLILPLKRDRRVDLAADLVEETSTEFHTHHYIYENIDIILLEGIFLFKRCYVEHFDLRIWIECSVEIAMKRAIARSQEGLSPQQTIEAYEHIYFPAQRLHFALDRPQASAHLTVENN